MPAKVPGVFFLIVFLISGISFSQSKLFPDFIVWENGDTVFCNITAIERTQGRISLVNYTTGANRQITLRNTFEVCMVRSINVNNEFFWENISAPGNNNCRHFELEVNGKLKIYSNKQLILKTGAKGEKYIANPMAKFGGISSFIKFENGEVLDLTKKNVKRKISDRLMSCEIFKTTFKARITKQNIVEAVRLYNKLCGLL